MNSTDHAAPLGPVLPPSIGTGPSATPPRLLDRVRLTIRARHYSPRTEKAYLAWIRRFIFFHGRRHPDELGVPEVTGYLSHLASQRNVSSSTQTQAFAAILFLYRDVLGRNLVGLDDVVRAKRPVRVPLVLARDEVRAILRRMSGTPLLMCSLMYGSGLRLLECCRLRVKDVDFDRCEITVHDGKGRKDRVTVLPARLDLGASGPSFGAPRASTSPTWTVGPATSPCRTRSTASTRTPAASGRGSGSSPRPASTSIPTPARGAGITSTRPFSSARSPRRCGRRASPSPPPATPSATRSPPTCSRPAATSAPSRSCSGTPTSRRP